MSTVNIAEHRRTTNIEFVRELMEHSSYGVLAQAFIIEAIADYADRVSELDSTSVEIPFITAELWINIAKEIKTKMDKKFPSNKS
jgi:hypothetical protein